VGRVDVTGAESVGSEAAARAFTLAPGTPFDTAGYTEALSNLRAYYRRAGYRNVKVDAVPIPRATEPRIDITLNVVEGPRSVLQGVTASGQANVRQGLFDKVTGLQTGGPVDPTALDRAQQRLYDTGIFDSVEVAVEPTAQAAPGARSGDQPVSAVFKLEERPHYRFRYGVQFGPTNIEDIAVVQNSAVPGATVELQRRNLFGAGLNVGVGGFWAVNQYRIRATAQTFTFLGRFLQTTATAETVQQDLLTSGNLEYLARSNRLIVEQRLRRGKTRRLEFAYGFEIDAAEVELLEPVRVASEKATISALESTLTWDTRDNPFNPGRGLFHSSRVEVSPGSWLSDIAFGRYQLQQFAYVPAGRLLFASGLRFGSLDVNDETQLVGLLLRFTTGGATTVRGYEQDSLVPEEYLGLERCLAGNNADRITCGGKVMLVFNEELRFPIYRWFGGVVFVDAGNTFEGLRQFSFDDLKVGAGVGLRLNTPVLVIRLDVGFPIPREPSGPLNRWYIGIGQAF
jgi:outer membrane protein insertion porin family